MVSLPAATVAHRRQFHRRGDAVNGAQRELWTCLSAVEARVVGGFRVVVTPAKPSSDAVNSVAGKAMALLRQLFIEAVTIPACLSSRKSRAGPFNPPSGKISPAAKSAPLTLRPFG
ncbi:hypothetical protein [Paracoccus binzhouensis]|uniref:hypothetical protein n=1 Tax=Paracoccus binzhouensis TaxID=2796149 RepID=UPI0018EF1200|nr:hypothetical protein [Paracoccus binzhouensis]